MQAAQGCSFAMKTKVSIDELQSRVGELDRIPSIPAILLPLLRLLDEPAESVNVQRVVDLISHDKSLAAQTLHMANSPLFGRYQKVLTVRGAVLTLGIGRVRDIATSCCMLNIVPEMNAAYDVRLLWEHSLGVALVSRRLARKVGFSNPDLAYLAGLLHDIGLIVNLMLFADEFLDCARMVRAERRGFYEIETEVLGFTHSVSGSFLAEHWGLSEQLKEPIRRHHDPESAGINAGIAELVCTADVLCRLHGLGYGFEEARLFTFWPHRIERLTGPFPVLGRINADAFRQGIETYVREVRNLVGVLFRLEQK